MNTNRMECIGILGAGVMGHSISQVFAQHGYRVNLCDVTEERLERARRLILSTLETLVEFGRLSPEEIPGILDRIQTTTDLAEAVTEADVVIEAVPEIPELKKALYSRMNRLCSRRTILASNTSGLDIFALAEVDSPERLVITHWFSPPYIIPLVEVVPGKMTSADVISRTVGLIRSVGKTPLVLKKFIPGFIVNRFQNAMSRTTFEMLDNGWASPEDIDLAIKHTLGIRLPITGIVQALDFTGLELMSDIMRSLGVKCSFLEEKVNRGESGVKTSKGMYDYGDRNEIEILKKRDRLYFKMLDHLKDIKAFEPV
jgi:3-hydroxybutyryl-CoA dehydrogenase